MTNQLRRSSAQRARGFRKQNQLPFAPLLALVAFNLQAGDPNTGFPIASPVSIPVAGGSWNGQRVFWHSRAGLIYELQTATELKAGPGGGLNWTILTNITGLGPVSWADDPGASIEATRYYRVLMQVPTNDVTPPVLSLIQATQPSAPPAPPISILSVSATDNVLVTSVEFLQGNNVLGSATRGLGDDWSFDWMAGAADTLLSGRYYLRARAFDAAGNVGYSPALQFDLASVNQACVAVGGLAICADNQVLNAGVYSFSGHIRINGIRLSDNGTLTATANQITGTGDVIVPGLDKVLSGSFDIDPQSGWLTVHLGGAATFPSAGIALSAQATAWPTQLSVNVLSNSISGAGTLMLQISNHVFGPAVFTGNFNYSPGTGTAAVTGSLNMNNLFDGTGTATMNLNDSTFTLTGDTRFHSSNGDIYSLSNGVTQLAFASPTEPDLYVSGLLGLPEGLAVQVQGSIAGTGEVELTGSGRGPIGGFNFDPIEATVSRPAGTASVVTVNFKGKLLNPNFAGYLFAGTVRSSGDLDITGSGDASFSGFRFSPLNLHFLRNASTTNQVIVNLQGTLRLSYVMPVVFNGVLRQDGSVDLTGQSGPYSAASFSGVVPRLDDPGLSFEQQTFIGIFQLWGGTAGVQTLVSFHFIRDADASGGNALLGLTAVTTHPPEPTLTLTGEASTTGACSLSGSLMGERFDLWDYTVNDLACVVSRNAQGVVAVNITGGTLSYGSLLGISSQATGSIASDRSGSAGFNFSSCTLGGYALQNVSLVLTQSSAGFRTLQMTAGSVILPGFATSSVALTGTFNNDGTFSLAGTTSDTLSLNGLAVTTVARGATVTLTQTGLTITGALSGGVLSQIASASGSAVGTLKIAPDGSASLTGCLTLSPLTFGQFQVRSAASDGSFSACFGPGGLMVAQNTVRLVYNGSPLTTPSLPSFSISLDGSFSISVSAAMTAGLTLDSYSLPNAIFTFNVAAGVATVQNFNASLSVPGFNPGLSSTSANAVSGSLNSNGSFSLTGTTSSAETLNGLAVTTLANGASLSLTQNGLTITGTLSGGILSHVASASGSAVGNLSVAPNGSASLTGCLTLSPLTFGQFQVRSTASDGNFSACFGPGGLLVGQNAVRLLYNGSPLTTPSLPSFSIALDGSFTISVTAAMSAGLTLNSYSLPNATFTFNVAAGVATVQNFNASLSVPGFKPGFSSTFVNAVSGSLNSDGSFSLTGTTGSADALDGLAVTTLGSGATLNLNQTGLSITGTIAGGVLSQVASASGSAIGTLTVAPNGSASLSGCLTLSPLTFGQFQIRSSAPDGSMSACFGPGGLVVGSASKTSPSLLYKGLPLTTPSLPSFTIGANGSFQISVTSSMTAGLTLDGFSLANAEFLFSVSGGVATVSGFTAKLSIPGSASGFAKGAVAVNMTGSMNSDGTFLLNGILNGSAAISTSLPITGVTAGATLTFSQTGLTMTGTFTGGVLKYVPVVSTTISVTIVSDGSMTASGTVSSSALVDNAIHVEPISGQTFDWTIINTGLSLPGLTAQVDVSGVFSSAIGLSGFKMNANGDFTVSLISAKGHIIAVDVVGYSFTGVGLTVSRNGGVLVISSFGGNLNIPGFGQHMTGGIDDLGNVTLDLVNASVSLAGFNATTDGTLALRNAGLTASGTLDISVGGTSLGSLKVVANVAPVTGSYSASGSTSLTFDGYTTSIFNATVSTSGITGKPNLAFGKLSVQLPNLSITTAGVSASGSAQCDSGWQKFIDVPGEIGDLYARLEGSVSVSVSGNGSVSANLSATFGWWVVTLNHCDPIPPIGDGNCFYNYGPDPIPSDHSATASGGISSNGQFCVNQSHCNLLNDCQNQFCFTLW